MNQTQPGEWIGGALPANVKLGKGAIIRGPEAFKRYHSRRDTGLTIGDGSYMDGVHFAIGPDASAAIGQRCCFTNAILLCEREIIIGNHVMIGWNATIADTDFHPLDPAARIEDAIACSPLGQPARRPRAECRAVRIGDDVCIGPMATILKGVSIGDGAWIEPGSMVTRDIPPGARVLGNPAQLVPFAPER
jgi:acetyltransferase-like isoleucine patch superfamily enzyme